jgi:flagellar protein FliS
MNPYLQTEAETLTPGQLLLKAYKDVLDLVDEAKNAIEKNDIITKAKAISKASRIINVLKAALDFEQGGEIAKNLDYLYAVVLDQLALANANNSVENLENVKEILTPLYEAWKEAVKKEEGIETENDKI